MRKYKKIILLILLLFTICPIKTLAYPKWFTYRKGASYINTMYKEVDRYPSFVKQVLIDNDIKIVLVEKEGYLEKKFNYKAIRGIFTGDEIYVESYVRKGIIKQYKSSGVSSKALKGYTDKSLSILTNKNVLLHELAHAVDFYTTYPSQSDEFYKIWKSEWKKFKSTTTYLRDDRKVNANINTPEEYFANASVCYLNYPSQLKKYCPKTYSFLRTFYTTMQKTYK